MGDHPAVQLFEVRQLLGTSRQLLNLVGFSTTKLPDSTAENCQNQLPDEVPSNCRAVPVRQLTRHLFHRLSQPVKGPAFGPRDFETARLNGFQNVALHCRAPKFVQTIGDALRIEGLFDLAGLQRDA